MTNPHARPYAFPSGKHPALSEYLNENTEYDPATGCLEWTGKISGDELRAVKAISDQYGSRSVARLAWLAHHDRKLDKGTTLVRSCGNPRCINPLHLREATPADQWHDPDFGPPTRKGSIGALKLGKREVSAEEVFRIQSRRPPRDPHLGLRWAFRYHITCLGSHRLPLTHTQQEKLEIIRAIRRCPIRASRTVLPCGFIRYDLPPGITEIAFTAPPPPIWEPLLAMDDEEDPETAPEADWANAA